VRAQLDIIEKNGPGYHGKLGESQDLLEARSQNLSPCWGAGSACHRFLRRHLPRFHRAERRTTATLVIRGLLGGLPRTTCEPIAVQAGVHRKPVQFLVGAGKWDDEAVMAELRDHVRAELGDDRAVLVIDASTFPKTGADSCGVARQGCGRLGKEESCQRGIVPIGSIDNLLSVNSKMKHNLQTCENKGTDSGVDFEGRFHAEGHDH
jgi:hypothetical protein